VTQAATTAAKSGRPFAEVLKATPDIRKHLDDAALARILDPAHYIGEAGAVIDRVLARARL